jgi:hypothetical protein
MMGRAFRQSDTETLPNFPSLILYLTQRILATTPLSLSLHTQKEGWREEESECYTDVVVVGSSSRERNLLIEYQRLPCLSSDYLSL